METAGRRGALQVMLVAASMAGVTAGVAGAAGKPRAASKEDLTDRLGELEAREQITEVLSG